MKKLLIIVLACIVVVAFAGCGEKKLSLLSQEARNVESVAIFFESGIRPSVTLVGEDMAPVIQAIQKVSAKEAVVEEGALWGNFAYALEVYYTDGAVDYLFSDGSGENYFRFVEDNDKELIGPGVELKAALDAI